jgi:hypothetical protein
LLGSVGRAPGARVPGRMAARREGLRKTSPVPAPSVGWRFCATGFVGVAPDLPVTTGAEGRAVRGSELHADPNLESWGLGRRSVGGEPGGSGKCRQAGTQQKLPGDHLARFPGKLILTSRPARQQP